MGMKRRHRPRCEWCGVDLREGVRADAKTCSKRCRQARHRFRIGGAPALGDVHRPMTFSYADPPYPGLARKYYDDQEVDHGQLIGELMEATPDGWALSTSATALQSVLRVCPDGVRIAAWLRGARRGKSHRARSSWEPVIVYGGRPVELGPRDNLCDSLVWGGRQPSHPGALVGMKPAPFCEWVFRLLGARQGDRLHDVFPGSGAVGRAWRLYMSSEYSSTLPSRLEEAQAVAASSLDGSRCR